MSFDAAHIATLHAEVARLHQKLEAKKRHFELKHKLLTRQKAMYDKKITSNSSMLASSIESKLAHANSTSVSSTELQTAATNTRAVSSELKMPENQTSVVSGESTISFKEWSLMTSPSRTPASTPTSTSTPSLQVAVPTTLITLLPVPPINTNISKPVTNSGSRILPLATSPSTTSTSASTRSNAPPSLIPASPITTSPSLIPALPITPSPKVTIRFQRFVQHIWPIIDEDQDGQLNSIEFANFIRKVTHDQSVVDSDCEKFLQFMDQDGNGKIDQNELMSFMLHGLTLGEDDIHQYGQRSSTHQLLAKVLVALKDKLDGDVSNDVAPSLIPALPITPSPKVTIRFQRFVQHIWPIIDEDQDGQLNSIEFANFIRKVTHDQSVVDSDCEKFLQFMDQDGNGKIDQNELMSFMLHGLTLGEDDIHQYGQRSSTHQLLAKVLVALKDKLDGDGSWPLHSGSPTWRVKPRHDTTGEGNIFGNMASMVHLVQKTNELAESSEVVIAMKHDKDEHHHVEELQDNRCCVVTCCGSIFHLCLVCRWMDDKESKAAKFCCKHNECRENHLGGQCRRAIYSFVCLFGVLILFAVWIQAIEAPLEISKNVEYINLMRDVSKQLTKEQFDLLSSYLTSDPSVGSTYFVSSVIEKLPSVSGMFGRYNHSNSTLLLPHVTADAWTASTNPFSAGGLGNTVFFVFTLATTIGYGHFAPSSDYGKLVSMFCLIVTVPLTVHVYLKITKLFFSYVVRIALARNGQLHAAFNHFDVDRSNSISYSELSAALEMLDIHLTKREVKHVMFNYDINCDGTLSMEEFRKIASDFDVNVGGVAIEHFKMRIVLILLLVWSLFYILYFHFVDAMSFVDAMWLCLATFTTTGLGDVVPSKSQNWPAMMITFMGLGLTALGIDAAVTFVQKTEERKSNKLDEKEHDAVEQKMRDNSRATITASSNNEANKMEEKDGRDCITSAEASAIHRTKLYHRAGTSMHSAKGRLFA